MSLRVNTKLYHIPYQYYPYQLLYTHQEHTNNYSLLILFSFFTYLLHFSNEFFLSFFKTLLSFFISFLALGLYTPARNTPQTSIIAEARRDLDIILVCPAGGVFIIVILIFIKVVFFLTTKVSFINTIRMSFFNQQILSYQPYV